MRSMKTEITMPKLAGNSISASTSTAAPPSQWTALLTQLHWKVTHDCRAHQATPTITACRASDSSSDCQMTPRSRGSPSCWMASSKARIMSSGTRASSAPSARMTSLGADDPGCLQLTDLLGGEAALAQHLFGVLAALSGGSLDRFLGAREARRGGGLREARHVDIGVARLGMRMLRGLLHGEHGGEADVAAFHDRAPFVARLGLEDLGEPAFELRPGLAVHLCRQRFALQARLFEQQ